MNRLREDPDHDHDYDNHQSQDACSRSVSGRRHHGDPYRQPLSAMGPSPDSPRAASSPGADDRDLEEQPFLQGDAVPSAPEDKLRKSSRHSPWKLAVYLVLVVVTVFGLSALTLNLDPPTHAHAAQEDDHGHDDANDAQQAPEVIHYHEDVPSAPRVRDGAEYVLDMAWDFDAPPTTREYHWTVADADLNPDGVFRPMVLINNQFPGPLVECNDGDRLVVRLDNRAANATAIHFHGLLFRDGANPMDGTVGVTQCPVAPDSSFVYEFDVRAQSGTYWYHAHHSAQAADGLVGPVVVHARHERRALQALDYASDRVLMLQDHYHNTTAELLMDYLKPGNENDEPVPDNPLLNGRGARDCADFPGWRCDAAAAASASPQVLDLAAGRRHRLRVLNVGAFAEFQVQLDQHPFYVTEVDGTDVHPEPFHRLNVLPAQRYSVVVEANATSATDSDDGLFWLRARMVTHCFTTKNPRLEPEIRAVLRYVPGQDDEQRAPHDDHDDGHHPPPPPALDRLPSSQEWPDAIEVICRDLNTSALHPVVAEDPPPADDFLVLRANFEIGAWRLARGFFNASTWRPNATHPSLHRFLDAPPAAAAALPEAAPPLAANDAVFNPASELVLQTTGVRTVDISLNNFDDGAHPFHLHGHRLYVLAQGASGYPPASAAQLAPLVPPNPLRRDTVTVEGYAWAVVRVVLDNPGLWALHCHNAWHAEAGMAMQLLVRADVVRGWALDPQRRDMCALPGVERGARPDDSIWYGF